MVSKKAYFFNLYCIAAALSIILLLLNFLLLQFCWKIMVSHQRQLFGITLACIYFICCVGFSLLKKKYFKSSASCEQNSNDGHWRWRQDHKTKNQIGSPYDTYTNTQSFCMENQVPTKFLQSLRGRNLLQQNMGGWGKLNPSLKPCCHLILKLFCL